MKFAEDLNFNFEIELSSFEYFTNNCKANLKKLPIFTDDEYLAKDYLICVNRYQNFHNSLKIFGINNLMDEELEIIDLLKNQGVKIILPY